MAEERCALCKEAGQTNVLASYKGVPKGMSATGKAIPPMCYAHRNNTKPTWMSNEDWLAKKEPVLRNHAVAGGPRMELNTEAPERVEEALRLAGLSSQKKTPHLIEEQDIEPGERLVEQKTEDFGRVACKKQVSPQCEKTVSAAKVRQICAECWSYMHLQKKATPSPEKPVQTLESPTRPLVNTIDVRETSYQMPDETLEAMLEQVWESQDERIVVAVMQECFSDLPRAVQVRLVQTALQERKSRLPQPNSRGNGLTDADEHLIAMGNDRMLEKSAH